MQTAILANAGAFVKTEVYQGKPFCNSSESASRASSETREELPHRSAETTARGHYLDNSDQSNYRKALFKRLGRLSRGHSRALDMAAFIQEETNAVHGKVADSLRRCGAWLVFREFVETGKFKLAAGMFCQKHLLCPLCAQLRAGRSVAKYWEKVNLVLKDSKLSLLTLTIKNGPELRERFAHFVKSVNRLFAKARNARNGGRDVTEFSKFRGGVLSLETKRGSGSGEWHVHGHALCIQDSKVNIEALREEWHNITRDSTSVDLQLIRGDPLGGFCEVFKYAMKFADLPLADNWDAYGALGGKRLLRPWGALWGVKVPEGLEDEGFDEDAPYVERFFRFVAGTYRYQRREERGKESIDGK